MKHQVKMTQKKETKWTVVYEALELSPGSVICKSVYLAKAQLPRPFPKEIVLTVECEG